MKRKIAIILILLIIVFTFTVFFYVVRADETVYNVSSQTELYDAFTDMHNYSNKSFSIRLGADINISDDSLMTDGAYVVNNGNNLTIIGNSHTITFSLFNKGQLRTSNGTINLGSSDGNDTLYLKGLGEGNNRSDSLIYVENGTLNMYNGVSCSDNSGLALNGGAVSIYSSGTFNMYGGIIENNNGTIGGAVVIPYGSTNSTFNMYGGTLRNNTADQWGGAIYADYYDTENIAVNITGGTISGNQAAYGGAIAALNGNIHIENTTIENNVATAAGGALVNYVYADVTMNSNVITGNEAPAGGAIYSGSNIVSTNDEITLNNADEGGGIYVEGSSADFSNTLVYNNKATSAGNDYAIGDEASTVSIMDVTNINKKAQFGTKEITIDSWHTDNSDNRYALDNITEVVNPTSITAGTKYYLVAARTTIQTESDNANLSAITVSSGVIDELEPENSTYKEYTLTPTFNKDEINYEITLSEYRDTLDIKSVLEDNTATMKIKVPKKENGELVYVNEELQYEETTLTDNTLAEVTVNKLGEPDTEISIIVTAEDTTTTKTYKVTIKRPFGRIIGSAQLGEQLRKNIDDSYGIYVKYIANCTLYKAGEFDWNGIVPGTSSLSTLDNMDYEVRVITDESDGSYEMYVIPGTYDLLIERLGFLANVTTDIIITDGETIDLGNKILIEGDVDRNGIIDLDDMVELVNVMDTAKGDGIYQIWYDFGNKEFVSLDDLVSTVSNCDQLISISSY